MRAWSVAAPPCTCVSTVASVDTNTLRRLVAAARVGRLATVSAEGTPHLVPICFAVVGDVAYSAVDHKPKTTTRLRRIENVRATGRACILIDGYDEDWSRLWWVRLDGRGRVVDDRDEASTALAALAEKYEQYAARRPEGPILAVDVANYSSWAASPA
jgi:PPOX class probable F420-dependent enzyme